MRNPGRLVAGAAGVHVVLGEHVGVGADADHFGGRGTESFLGPDFPVGYFRLLAEAGCPVLDVEVVVQLRGHPFLVRDLSRIKVGVAGLVAVANHGDDAMVAEVKRSDDGSEGQIAIRDCDRLGMVDNLGFAVREDLDDLRRATAVLEGGKLAVEQPFHVGALHLLRLAGKLVLRGHDGVDDVLGVGVAEKRHQFVFQLVFAKHGMSPFPWNIPLLRPGWYRV